MSKTLSSFEWLLAPTKHVIRCPQMYLDGWHDHQPPIFEGSGQIILEDAATIHFQFDARARDPREGLQALRRCAAMPNDQRSAMRLRATDYGGTEWNAGWVLPQLGEISSGFHHLFGECRSLLTGVRHDSSTSGVELVYSPAPDVPFTEVMSTTARIGGTQLGKRTSGGRHQMELLGAEITAMTRPWSSELSICATTSEHLNHPYLENWLSEPLRALRGQLIYPRLVARNFADGTANVWVRTAPELTRSMGGCASQLKNRSAAEFWSFHEAYLSYVATHRDSDGYPGFEANELTRLHEEVIQARIAGSNWVIALCLASV